VLSFKSDGRNVLVSDNQADVCRKFCGARAGFTGLYILPTAGCTAKGIAAGRTQFKRKYDKKIFPEAISILSTMLNDCKRVLHRFEMDWIRNDLALAQLKNGDKAACLKTLSPLVELANYSDAEIRAFPEPTYVDSYLSIAKATRTNLKLCKSAP
jgi:hypothetical protein